MSAFEPSVLHRSLIAAAAITLAAPATDAAAQRYTATSPSKAVTAEVTIANHAPRLAIKRDGRVVLRAELGRMPNGKLKAERATLTSPFTTVTGKRRQHLLNATRLTLNGGHNAKLDVVVANDGVAFREQGFSSQTVRYLPLTGTRGYLQKLISSYEGDFKETPIKSAGGRIGYPALLAVNTKTYALLTETGVPHGQPGEHLTASKGTLVTQTAKGTKGRTQTGWRLAIVGTLADIVASDLPDALATPTKLTDTAWIRPGRVAWSWWYDSASPTRLDDQRYYADYAASEGFEYITVDEGWNAAWVPTLVAYAAQRGVRVLLWTDWHALATPAQRKAALDQWSAWGIAGIKVDFLQSDSGERLALMDDIAADAAARHLLVDFHGCTIPRGLQRTWPNVLTVEAVWGAEHAKSGNPDNPALNVTLAFTRNPIGSMDYTPVTFSASGRQSTAAAQLAQAIVYESGLQHYADHPSAYMSRPPAFELLKTIPAAWDDTRLVAGAPARWVTLARRSGARWFVGSLSALEGHSENVALGFLDPGRTYTARIYADDGRDGIAISERTVTSTTVLPISVARNGGFSIVLTP